MSRAAVALACASLALASGCRKPPAVRIDSPQDGAALTAAFDLDPAAAGVQVAVDASVDAPDGSEAWAAAGAAPARAVVAGGKAHFARVTIPDGDAVLRVTAVDSGSQKLGAAQVQVHADSLARGCRFVEPAPGLVRTDDPGDGQLWSQRVALFCRGLAAAAPVSLFLDQGAAPLRTALDAAGNASFTVDLVPGVNLLFASAGDAQAVETVTVQSSRCRVALAPPSGTLLNAAFDRDTAAPGMQARITATTACADAPIRLEVTQGGRRVLSQTGAARGGAAQFDLTLPEGADVAVQAFAGGTGLVGASRAAHYAVDSVVPALTLDSPAQGALLVDGDDADPAAPGFQVRFTGHAGGLAEDGALLLHLDDGAAGGGQDLALPTSGGSFSQLVTVSGGAHQAQLFASRPSGNSARSAPVSFVVAAVAPSLALVAPPDGAVLNLSTLAVVPGGALATLQLRAVRLSQGSIDVSCGGAATRVQPVPADGLVTAQVFLPLAGCAASRLTCTAVGTPVGPPGVTATAAPITLFADASAPQVTLGAPAANSSTRAAAVDLHAATACAAEAGDQRFELRVGGALAASGAILANRLDLTGASAVQLAPGANLLELTAIDPSGNRAAASATVTRLVGDPQPAFLAPAAHAVLTSSTVTVQVQLGNRPAGSAVELRVASADAGGALRRKAVATTQDVGGSLVATFAGVQLPEGTATLQACVTDPTAPPPTPTCITEQVTVSTGRAVCNLVAPSDGQALHGSDDTRADLPGFQTSVSVQTSGGGPVQLVVTNPDGSQQRPPARTPGGGGLQTVRFADLTLPADGAYSFDATCADPVQAAGVALTNAVSLATRGPAVAFSAPAAPYVLNASTLNSSTSGGFATDVQLAVTGGDGGVASLVVDCGAGPSGPFLQPVLSGGSARFNQVQLLAHDPGEARCTLTAAAQDSSGNAGLPLQIAVTVDRTVPAPAWSTPQDGAIYPHDSAALDCSTPSSPVLRQAAIALTDAVPASGLSLLVNGAAPTCTGGPCVVSAVTGGFTIANLALPSGPSTVSVTATDAAGNTGSAQASFSARCTTPAVTLNLVGIAGGGRYGVQQDLDLATPGEQVNLSVGTQNVPAGTAVRICSTAGTAQEPVCDTAGTFAIAFGDATRVNGSGAATFQATLPEGPQQLVAEVVDDAGNHGASASRAVTVRSVAPPPLTALAVREDANPHDAALNQAELDAAPACASGSGKCIHFDVTFGPSTFAGGSTLSIFSSAIGSGPIGQVALPAGPPPSSAAVEVPLAQFGALTGYQQHTFTAAVQDDGGNLVGTPQLAFVLAPLPPAALLRPGAAVTRLLAADDDRCAPGPCPLTAPLLYTMQGSTGAASGSSARFLQDGTAVGGAISLSSGSFAAPRSLANEASASLAVQVTDPYGNVSTSPARALAWIDSVPPAVAFQSQAAPCTSYPCAVSGTVQDNLQQAGSFAGQQVLVRNTADANQAHSVGSAAIPAAGSGAPIAVAVSLFLSPNGSYTLAAAATDAAGNPAIASPASFTVVESSTTPTVQLTAPPQTSGVYYFTSAQPPLAVSVSSAPLRCQVPGCQIAVFSSTAADCSGALADPGCGGAGCVAGFVADAAGSGTASFAPTLADGQQGYLCPELIVPGIAQPSLGASQQYAVDLTTPAVAFTSPSPSQLFVGFGQTVPQAIANAVNDTANLQADFGLTVTGRAGSVVTLTGDGAPMAAGTGSYTLPADCPSGCAVTITGKFAAAAGGVVGHSIGARIAAPSGNSATSALPLRADLVPPADPQATITVSRRLAGVVQVQIAAANIPADDGTAQSSGRAAAWDVRFGATPLTASNWSSGQPIAASLLVPAGSVPGAFGQAQTFTALLPANQAALSVGVRAVDAAGNLSAFTAASVPTTLSAQGDVAITNNSALSPAIAPVMRVIDLDGDGFDDVVLSYPSENVGGGAANNNTGVIFVYFGAAAGLDPAPLKLVGSATGAAPADYPGRTLGRNPRLDVGHFSGTSSATNLPQADIAAGYFKSDFSEGKVYVWTGAALAAAKAAKGAVAPIVITSPASTAIGLVVRNGGHVTSAGAPANRDDLLIGARTQTGFNYRLMALSRTAFSSWSTALATGAESFDIAMSGVTQGLTTFDAMPIDALTGPSDPDSLFVAQGSTVSPAFQRSFTIAGSQLKLGTVAAPVTTNASDAWVYPLTDPTRPAAPNPAFGLFLAGGADAVGDATKDLVVADGSGKKKLFVYDGAQLLSRNQPPTPAATLDVSGEAGAQIGQCAVLLPDLDGDGKADVSGCIDGSLSLNAAHLFFSGPDLAYLAATPTPLYPSTSWAFTPRRGQRIDSSSAGFGVLVGAGHLSSLAPRELVVLVAPGSSINNHVLRVLR